MSVMRALQRKGAQVLGDPVLRQWLLGAAFGRHAILRSDRARRPPYLASLSLQGQPRTRHAPTASTAASPTGPLTVTLPGIVSVLQPGQEHRLFERHSDDLEVDLAVHRFAWLPLTANPGRAWLSLLWQQWWERYAAAHGTWAWHPYTTAERAINILDAGRRFAADDLWLITAQQLQDHAAAIYGQLEYFGEHYTGNHLANNGRGLLRIGLAIGWTECADAGATILLNEAARIFAPSGLLREGSSHYHLLVTRNYVDAWLAAKRDEHPATARLAVVAGRALAASSDLLLPAGLPLIGDISPDCPPSFLAGLVNPDTNAGWIAMLDGQSRTDLRALMASPIEIDAKPVHDGWLRASCGPWSGLWHLPPDGWSPTPGHGHQDAGSFELHWRDVPLFVDPGRGRYGEDDDAAYFRSALAHNGLTIDDEDPYPQNRPYYSRQFRHRAGGGAVALRSTPNEVELSFGGYRRCGVGLVTRRWRFTEGGFSLTDNVAGSGTRRLTRRLVTPLPVELDRGEARVRLPAGVARISADGSMSLAPTTRWTAYGEGQPATQICVDNQTSLPWAGILRVEIAE